MSTASQVVTAEEARRSREELEAFLRATPEALVTCRVCTFPLVLLAEATLGGLSGRCGACTHEHLLSPEGLSVVHQPRRSGAPCCETLVLPPQRARRL